MITTKVSDDDAFFASHQFTPAHSKDAGYRIAITISTPNGTDIRTILRRILTSTFTTIQGKPTWSVKEQYKREPHDLPYPPLTLERRDELANDLSFILSSLSYDQQTYSRYQEFCDTEASIGRACSRLAALGVPMHNREQLSGVKWLLKVMDSCTRSGIRGWMARWLLGRILKLAGVA